MTTLDECLEGTSARTRPLSFNEIVERRKNKVTAVKQLPDGAGLSDIASAGGKVKKARHSSESDRKLQDGGLQEDSRHVLKDPMKISSRRKKDASPSKNEKMNQDRYKRSTRPEASSKVVSDKHERSDRILSSKNERRNHGGKERDGVYSDSVDARFELRQGRDLTRNDMVSERPRVKSEIIRERPVTGDGAHLDRKRKTDDDRPEIRNASDLTWPDRLSDGRKDRSETERRQKRYYDDDKTKRSSMGKKQDLERQGMDSKRTHAEESRSKKRRSRSGERDKERGRRSPSHSPKSHKHSRVEESRSKRKLSRSREHDKERDRKSPSRSPMQHKHTCKDKREHGDLFPRPTKDKSGIEHSDVDKKRISTNGSSSQKRNTVSSSGLGGYSPRKRKPETSPKTPSPTRRSPERRNAGWDLPPVGKEGKIASSTLFDPSISGQNIPLDVKELPIFAPVTQLLTKSVGSSHHTLTSKIHATESVQLTQATRPMRRLYAENLPTSASEKDLMECINKFLLSCGVTYIHGTRPCISCIIHKEKGQALLEFLTPEDASAALSFDGMFFSGSTLKLRRPKDYTDVTNLFLCYLSMEDCDEVLRNVEFMRKWYHNSLGFQTVAIFMQTGLNDDKSVVAVETVSDVVEDSPHKIFLGGISEHISSQMLLDIAKAFGPVRAYHFECIADSNDHYAFLEYVDHSLTSRACAGLNGMRLGGQVITAALATPDAVFLESIGKPQFYEVPNQAKPLLAKPTTILMLKNVLDPEGLLLLSESELEEILEDIRLECSRYGTVKSINVAKPNDNSKHSTEACENKDMNASFDCNIELADKRYVTEQLSKPISELAEHDRSEPSETLILPEINSKTAEDNNGSNAVRSENLVKDENDFVDDPSSKEDGSSQQITSISESGTNSSTKSVPVTNKALTEEDLNLEETNAETGTDAELDHDEKMSASEQSVKNGVAIEFEPASVFVEYRRAEAACIAAHSLNGRVFDGRVVTVGYIDHAIYHKKIQK